MTPPLRARLHWYKLTSTEFALLTAMCEHSSDGSAIWASVPRLSAYSKLSERTVQYVIRDLCARGILSRMAEGNSRNKRRPAVYRVNEAGMEDDPKMRRYHINQRHLPGLTGAKAASRPVQNLHWTGATYED